MAFDADLAGINAARRAIELALGLGFEVKIALLPPNRDPADLIRTDPENWRQAVRQAVHIIDFLLTILTRQELGKRQLAHAIEREVYPFIARLANPPERRTGPAQAARECLHNQLALLAIAIINNLLE